MSWSYRKSGKRYLRRNFRDKTTGQVRTEYLGKGELAELKARQILLERDLLRHQVRRLLCEAADLEETERPFRLLHADAIIRGHRAMHELGYHQHHRGEWRRRSMTTTDTTTDTDTTAPENPPAAPASPATPTLPLEALAILAEFLKEKPADLDAITDREILLAIQAEGERLARFHEVQGDLPTILADQLIKEAAGPGAAEQALLRQRFEKVRGDLAGPHPSPAVAILADRVSLAWLEAFTREIALGKAGADPAKILDTKSKLADRAGRRLLASTKLLHELKRRTPRHDPMGLLKTLGLAGTWTGAGVGS